MRIAAPYTRGVPALFDHLAAMLAGVIPRRYWGHVDLPIAERATLAGVLTLLAGCALGITGFFAYMAQLMVIDWRLKATTSPTAATPVTGATCRAWIS